MSNENYQFIKGVKEIKKIMKQKNLTFNKVAVELKVSRTGIKNYLGAYDYSFSPNMKKFIIFYKKFMEYFN